ncbi:MAG: hypothetical protein ABL999_05495 [Pyrinomonadaceae bacterium]
MKGISTVAFLLLWFVGVSLAQASKPDLTADEERDAKTLAVAFFSRYRATRDITPLFREFFVSDFSRRLEFCRSTSHCEGFARDFWKDNEDLPQVKPTRSDYIRHYAAVINITFLAFDSMNHLAKQAGRKPEDYWETADKIINERLALISKRNSSRIFKEFVEDGSDNALDGLKSLRALRKRIRDFEELAADLRLVERAARIDLKRAGKILGPLRPEDFWANDEVNTGRFFDYSMGTKLIGVWPEDVPEIPFKMDLIAEKGHLRIVAVYPPMD